MFDLENLLKENQLVLLDFYTPHCGSCKMMSPVIDDLSSTYSDRLSVFKIDAEEESDLASKFNIMAVPVIQLYKNGELKHQFQGPMSKIKLEGLIKDLL